MNNGQRAADNGQKCIHCPTPESIRCGGLDVRRFCELIDPSYPQYDSRYREVVIQESGYALADKDAFPGLNPHHPIGKRIADRGEAVVVPANCCGGMAPGIFDEAGFNEPSPPAPAVTRNERARD